MPRASSLMAMGRPFDLPYSVELWDDANSHVEELIALTGRWVMRDVNQSGTIAKRSPVTLGGSLCGQIPSQARQAG